MRLKIQPEDKIPTPAHKMKAPTTDVYSVEIDYNNDDLTKKLQLLQKEFQKLEEIISINTSLK